MNRGDRETERKKEERPRTTGRLRGIGRAIDPLATASEVHNNVLLARARNQALELFRYVPLNSEVVPALVEIEVPVPP